MRALQLDRYTSLLTDDAPLRLLDLPVPEPGPGEILIEVSMCGVCHTELDEIEGRLPVPTLPVVPGHQVVGRIAACGDRVTRESGERVGVGWIHHSCGGANENISDEFVATGLHVNGGYAEYLTVPQAYAFPIPDRFSDADAAPLLCAGAIGFRALELSGLRDGDTLGLTGFGGSAHIVIQLARHRFPRSRVFVFARDASARDFARSLGAEWVGDTTDRAPELLDAVIDTTPAWTPVVRALENLKPGGRLVINAIRKEDGDKTALLELDYHRHLWMEREIKSVANITGNDIATFLPLAAAIPILTEVEIYPLECANEALVALKREPVRGAKVLRLR